MARSQDVRASLAAPSSACSADEWLQIELRGGTRITGHYGRCGSPSVLKLGAVLRRAADALIP